MREDDRALSLSYPLGFLSRAAGFAMLACLVGLWILRWVFARDLGNEYAPAFYLLKHLLAFLLPALAFSLLSVLLVAALAIFAVAVFASHKVAGPLFRLQRVAGYLNRWILIGRIHLRAGDQGKPLASAINEWVARRKKRLDRLRSLVQETEAALQTYVAAADQRDPEGLGKAAGQLKRKLQEFEELDPRTSP